MASVRTHMEILLAELFGYLRANEGDILYFKTVRGYTFEEIAQKLELDREEVVLMHIASLDKMWKRLTDMVMRRLLV